MKVLLVNGSCKANGSTNGALLEVAKTLNVEGIETEIFQIGTSPIRDCMACGGCVGKGKCVFDDDNVNKLIEKAKECDGFVFGSPVYYAHPDGRVLCLLDRAFYAGKHAFRHKPAAVVAVARRAGTTATLDALSKYASISEMPLVSSSYWNMVHGNAPAEIFEDKEGLQTMRNLALNMAWILKCIEAGREAGVEVPDTLASIRTNFIR